MKRSILALASGAFILGAAEFVMMGILPQTATAMHVSIPAAGHYISAYAIGVCRHTDPGVRPQGAAEASHHPVHGHRVGRQHAQRRLLLLADAAGGAFHFRPAAWRVLRHGHADRQNACRQGQGGAIRVHDGDGPDGGQHAGRARGNVARRGDVLAAGVCDSGRLGAYDDRRGDFVGAVHRSDQGRRHQGAVPLPHPSRPVADSAGRVLSAIRASSAGGATCRRGCRKPADGRRRWCRY